MVKAADGAVLLRVEKPIPDANGKAGLVLGRKPPFSSLSGVQGTQGEGPECQHQLQESGAS